MQYYYDITARKFASAKLLAGAFLHKMGTKIWWVFGSVSGLVVLAASFAAVNRNFVTYGDEVEAQPAMTQQVTSVSPAVRTPHISTESHTVITQTQEMIGDEKQPVRTSLHVNGTPVELPAQGTVHKDVYDANGKTSVDVSINATSSGDSTSNSSSSVTLQSMTESSTRTDINSQSIP